MVSEQGHFSRPDALFKSAGRKPVMADRLKRCAPRVTAHLHARHHVKMENEPTASHFHSLSSWQLVVLDCAVLGEPTKCGPELHQR